MSEPLEFFREPAAAPDERSAAAPMTPEQRAQIRSLFAQLGVSTAREQFALVAVLIGVKLTSVSELDAKRASALVPRLRQRVETRAKTLSGNSWTDRDEDTWIDKL